MLNRIIIATIMLFNLLSCNQNNSTIKNVEEKSKLDLNTEQNQKTENSEIKDFYSRINLDTIRYTQKINIENINHNLELKLYSLNDSSIVRENDGFKEFYHNTATEIILTRKNDTILFKKLTKEKFKDSIDSRDYLKLSISGIGYGSVRSNKLYMNISLDDPSFLHDSFFRQSSEFGIFYRTQKKGQISFNRFKHTRE